MAGSEDVDRFRPLATAPLHILLSLRADERDVETIIAQVEALTDGTVVMGRDAMSRAIRRLLADGLIERAPQPPDSGPIDLRHRCYRLTGLGDRLCEAEICRLEAVLERVGPRPARPARTRPRLLT